MPIFNSIYSSLVSLVASIIYLEDSKDVSRVNYFSMDGTLQRYVLFKDQLTN